MNKLRKELRLAGAKDKEILSLIPIAASLARLKPKTAPRWIKPVSFLLSGLALGAFVIILSQASPASGLLFPIQKATDNLAIILTPSYRADVMMKRADQVNQLVASHSSDDEVMTALNDYTKVAQAYQSTANSYTAFSYCKTRLLQAAVKASPRIQAAINTSLQSIETT
ncbi:MAG: hypothetical protein JWO99_767 [Candidatus Saccharibacteria bacterium]|nr:hypothetical protein [Candidatus Saccharibacteria bacterium]